MTIKLIASDMDGTLLNSNQKISEENKNAIKRATNLGIKFVISTGRMYCAAEPFGKELDLKTPIISYNGALVKERVSGNIINECSLSKELAIDVMKFAFDRGVYAQTYVDDKLLVRKKEFISDYYAKIANVKYHEVGDDIFNIASDPHKVLLMTNPGDLELNFRIKEELMKEFGDRIHTTNSMTDFIEIMNPKVNKWEAVKIVAKQYDIKPDEIMCLGDGNNDLDMIANAAYGVAMENAFEGVKQVANFVTKTNDEDGFAFAINNFFDKLEGKE